MRRIFTTLMLCLIMIGCAFADTYRVTAHSTLNVRSAPSTKSRIVARLTSGQKVEVLSIQGKWAKISINGKLKNGSLSYAVLCMTYAAQLMLSRTNGFMFGLVLTNSRERESVCK